MEENLFNHVYTPVRLLASNGTDMGSCWALPPAVVLALVIVLGPVWGCVASLDHIVFLDPVGHWGLGKPIFSELLSRLT